MNNRQLATNERCFEMNEIGLVNNSIGQKQPQSCLATPKGAKEWSKRPEVKFRGLKMN